MKSGSKVHCRSFLQKDSDGIHIEAWDEDKPVLTKIVNSSSIKAYAYGRDKMIKELDEWQGDGIEKTYRRKIESEFDGIYVGTVTVKVKGMIGTDWTTDYYGREYGYFYKRTTETATCGVVYYLPNKKRYVPIEDMAERKEE